MKRAALITSVAAALVLLICGGSSIALLDLLTDSGRRAMYGAMGGCADRKLIKVSGKLPSIGGLTDEQMRNAQTIIEVGCELGISPRGWVIAIATAVQESKLYNRGHLGERNDHDSLGLFQQRPSQGWGTPKQVTDPRHAAREFYQKLQTISGWAKMRLTDAAQKVQRSAYPDAYQQWESVAADVVYSLTGCAGRPATGAPSGAECAAAGPIAASGWTLPVKAHVVSGFRTSDRPGHDGIDLGAPRGTLIRAASAGVVLAAMCNASTGNCDVDGSPAILGCGWHVDIRHAANVITRYCHMQSRPHVRVGQRIAAGQVLGKVGSSGNSSGPHLHYEVHINGDAGPGGAVDPMSFMAARGAGLGARA